MEWSAPAILLATAPLEEGNLVASVFAEAPGLYRGLVRGGASRRQAATWQAGNLVEARWVARLPEQLGMLAGELIHPTAALAMASADSLAILAAACATAAESLPEREPHPRAFRALLDLLARGAGELPRLARFELTLLEELGFGLDIERCALTGATTNLAYVSPRTGRAVTAAAAGDLAPKLLPLPDFDADPAAALHLTGYFLARNVFGQRHRPLPAARLRLQTRLEKP